MLKNKVIGFIGAGNMGEALIKGLLASGKVNPAQIVVSDRHKERLAYMLETYKVGALSKNSEVTQRADIIILAVKPDVAGAVLKEIREDLSREKLLISIAAGVTTNFINNHLLHSSTVIRVMPNTPAIVLEGVSAIFCGGTVSKDAQETAMEIFSSIGKSVAIEDEGLMDVVTGLSGSGPAFVFLFLEALTDGGVKMGLKRDVASLLSAQLFLGSAKLVMESEKHLGELKDMVTSPGGTTITGLHVLEKRGVRGALIEAVEAATRRSKELSGEEE